MASLYSAPFSASMFAVVFSISLVASAYVFSNSNRFFPYVRGVSVQVHDDATSVLFADLDIEEDL